MQLENFWSFTGVIKCQFIWLYIMATVLCTFFLVVKVPEEALDAKTVSGIALKVTFLK